MVYNMMMGDIQGYEDMEQAKKDETNYGFSWRNDMLENLEQDLLKQSNNHVDIASSAIPNEASNTEKQGHESNDSKETRESESFHSKVKSVTENEDLVNREIRYMEEENHKAIKADLSQDYDVLADSLSQIFGIKNVKISKKGQEISKEPAKQLSAVMDYSFNEDIYDDLEVFLYPDEEDAGGQTVFYLDGENDDIETALYLLGDDLEIESEPQAEHESIEKMRKDELLS